MTIGKLLSSWFPFNFQSCCTSDDSTDQKEVSQKMRDLAFKELNKMLVEQEMSQQQWDELEKLITSRNSNKSAQ